MRFTTPLGMAVLICLTGCQDSDVSSNLEAGVFRFDETNQVIFLDTRVPPPQRRQFGLGQGSITVETKSVSDNKLTFEYTPEVEGGYATYECTVTVSSTPVTFEINRDGTPGNTSFELSDCRLIRSGNLLIE